MIGQTVSHYRITEALGAGGMGEVYLATDTKLDRQVALKFLPAQFSRDADARARFEREAKALAALDHPNIIAVHDIGEHEGVPFIVIEYVDGSTLKELAATDQTIEQIVDFALQAAEGLAAAHDAGVVHRDIKSDNIIVSNTGRVKIMDFGLATWRGVTKVTQDGSTVGTMSYMSPEQAQGRPVDHRSDLWSLGVVLYELLTRHLPFTGDHDAAILYAIAHETPYPVSHYTANVPDALQSIVGKLLCKDPDGRYQTAADLLADLRAALTADGRVSASRTRRTRPHIIAGSVVVLLIVVALAVFRPWSIEFNRTSAASAAGNLLAVMYFDNLVDPYDSQRLGKIISNLLITDMSESRHVKVVSSQRLFDILRQMNREDVELIDETVAAEIARRAKATWMLSGSVLQTEPTLVVTSQLVEVKTGTVLASSKVTGVPDETVFALVDRLTTQIKQDLALPFGGADEPERNVVDITTASTDAYRLYLEGIDLDRRQEPRRAAEKFQQAIALDSAFAAAHYRLALANRYHVGTPELEFEAARNAYRFRSRAGTLDSLYIEAKYADVIETDDERWMAVLNEIVERFPDEKEAQYRLAVAHRDMKHYDQAIPAFHRALELDSTFGEVYNELSAIYVDLGPAYYDSAFWAINKYIETRPNECNPLDSRGVIYGNTGNLDRAISSFIAALELDSTFVESLDNIAAMYLLKGEFKKADSCYLAGARHAPGRAKVERLLNRSRVILYQGHFREAQDYLMPLVDSIRTAHGDSYGTCDAYMKLGFFYRNDMRDLDSAARYMEEAIAMAERVNPKNWRYIHYRGALVTVHADLGSLDSAQALMTSLRRFIAEQDMDYPWLDFFQARLDMAVGDYETAVTKYEAFHKQTTWFWYKRQLADAYLAAGRVDDAIAMYEWALSRYDRNRASHAANSVRTHFILGTVYESVGRNADAIAQYETFLDIWRDADPDIPELEDARTRLARIRDLSG